MKKKLIALLCAFFILGTLGFGQIVKGDWVKSPFTRTITFNKSVVITLDLTVTRDLVVSGDFTLSGGLSFGSSNISTTGTFGAGGPWTFTQNGDTYTFTGDGSNFTLLLNDGIFIIDSSEAAADAELGLEDASGDLYTLVSTGLSTDVTHKLNANSPIRTVVIKVYADDGALTLADGEGFFTVPAELDGFNLVSVGAHVYTASGGGTAVNIDIYNVGNSVDMLTTPITIDNSEKDSATAATPPVISTTAANIIVNTGDEIRVDINQVGDASTLGLEIRLGFQLVV